MVEKAFGLLREPDDLDDADFNEHDDLMIPAAPNVAIGQLASNEAPGNNDEAGRARMTPTGTRHQKGANGPTGSIGDEAGPEDEEASEEEAGRGKGKRKKRKVRLTEDAICSLVAKNEMHRMVLHAFYVHRRLTIGQLNQMYFRNGSIEKLRASILRLHSFGLLERKRIFSLARSLAETRTYHYGLSAAGIRVYALVGMNLSMLHEDPDLPKQHYYHSDLSVERQADHHYLLQTFLSDAIGTLWERKVFVPSAEWRRFLYLSENDTVHYKPDWIIFEPNDYYKGLVEEGRIGEDVLSVPVLTRNEQDKQVLAKHYRAMVSVECDTGTMRPVRLEEKFETIRSQKTVISKAIAILVGDGNLGEERPRWNDGKTRVRNIGQAVNNVLAEELISDELIFLIGRQSVLSNVLVKYVLHKGHLGSNLEELVKTTSGRILNQKDWKLLRVENGLPDFAYADPKRGKTVAVYTAYPGWLNPHIKAQRLLEKTDEKIVPVLLYPAKDMFAIDAHFQHSLTERIRFASIEEWQGLDRPIYRRVIDRSGEKWEVSSE